MTRLACTLCTLIALMAAPVAADERILEFHSDIVVAADASMQVTETIRVRGERDRINHGIYRDFPTDYRDSHGNRVRVEFEPLAVTRDGQPEPFRTESIANGERVYFGSQAVSLDPGEYRYTLRYRTTRQLGFFPSHDELYWNVTGNGWDFPIDQASATIILPGEIAEADITIEGYTGAQGSKEQAWRARVDAPSRASIDATRALGPQQGLTVVVGFPKGLVIAPTPQERAGWFLRDNRGVLIGGAGLVLLWLYYLVQWSRLGRDPKPGVIIPQYEAPADLSPGAMRYIERMGYDDRCLAADIVDLAVRGTVQIRTDDKVYSLHRAGSAIDELPSTSAGLLRDTLGSGDELVLERSEHARIGAARSAHAKALEALGKGRYFVTNTRQRAIGGVLAVAALVLGMVALGTGPAQAAGWFMLVWLSGWSVGVGALMFAVVKAWRSGSGIAGYGAALFLTLFSLPFVAGELFGLGVFVTMVGLGFALVVLALLLTNVLFFQWMKAPTTEGRKLLDRIAGLRLYLGVAERDQLAAQSAPSMTTEEFQRFLPYALALDVEKTWADRFAAAVGPAAAATATGALGWYHGSNHAAGMTGFTDSLGSSLSSAISSSSSAPGSSSGGGGGGSSGGGGGGGGGGGW